MDERLGAIQPFRACVVVVASPGFSGGLVPAGTTQLIRGAENSAPYCFAREVFTMKYRSMQSSYGEVSKCASQDFLKSSGLKVIKSSSPEVTKSFYKSSSHQVPKSSSELQVIKCRGVEVIRSIRSHEVIKSRSH